MKEDKILEAYEKMLEAKSYKDDLSPQEIIKNWDNKFYNEVRNKYFGVSDNISS